MWDLKINKQTKKKTKTNRCVKREISCISKQGFKFIFGFQHYRGLCC